MISELKAVVRSLARSPGYTSVVVGTLALGIGAAAAAYSSVAGSLFPTLPFARPEELVRIEVVNREQPQPTPPFLLRFLSYREATSVAGIAGSAYDTMNLLLNEEPEGMSVVRVTDNFFSLLGVAPALGRVFGPADGKAGSENVVVLSDWFWKNRLKSDPEVLQRELMLNGRPYRVVGVLGEDFRPPLAFPGARLYVPYVVPVAATNQNQWNAISTVARLKAGSSREQVQAELQTMHPERGRPIESYMEKFGVRVHAIDYPPEFPGYRRYRLMQWTGIGAVAFLYAIACVNAGNLMLVRTISRRRETGIRLALGGGRRDIARPLLLEGVMLALVSILLGFMVAKWLMPALLAIAPGSDDSWARNLKLSWAAVGFLAGLGLVTGMLVAAGPAWRAAHLNVNEAVKEGGAAMGESRRLRAVRGTLVVLEAALAVTLLTGAGLMVRTFMQLQDVKPGFEPVHRYNVNLQISREENLNFGTRRERYKQIAERLARVPGVNGASQTAMMLPNFYSPQKFKIAGRSDVIEVEAQGTPCSADFLEMLGVPLKAGRSLATLHEGDAPGVVINETMARTYFAGRNPVGEQLQINDKTLWEIIGVVGDIRSMRLEAKPRFYLPYWQPWGGVSGILLRTVGEPGPEFINEIRRAVYEIDPKFAVMSVTPLHRQLQQEVATEQFMLAVLEVMSVLALLLATMGMFAMMAYTVEQRRSEFGIRYALGATPGGIHRLVLGRGLALATTGVVLGLGLAWALSRFMESLLYQTKTNDPITYALVGGAMLLVAIPACWVPAHRATKVDLTVLLRPQ
ncbi:MAG TPA: ADOP family duplicated permease [Lacunisphaera sp.]|nr:ADOP family duplicated permease [Lacunisphaera sp.]